MHSRASINVCLCVCPCPCPCLCPLALALACALCPCPVPRAPCPVPRAPCPVPRALCPLPVPVPVPCARGCVCVCVFSCGTTLAMASGCPGCLHLVPYSVHTVMPRRHTEGSPPTSAGVAPLPRVTSPRACPIIRPRVTRECGAASPASRLPPRCIVGVLAVATGSPLRPRGLVPSLRSRASQVQHRVAMPVCCAPSVRSMHVLAPAHTPSSPACVPFIHAHSPMTIFA
eukprot:gene12902-biopygen4550